MLGRASPTGSPTMPGFFDAGGDGGDPELSEVCPPDSAMSQGELLQAAGYTATALGEGTICLVTTVASTELGSFQTVGVLVVACCHCICSSLWTSRKTSPRYFMKLLANELQNMQLS